MKIKVSEASGPVLDWMVAKCESERTRYQDYRVVDGQLYTMFCDEWLGAPYEPSTDWSRGGPIIDREGITVAPFYGNWIAARNVGELISDQDGDRLIVVMWESEPHSFGPTPLIAAMRCMVSSKLGEEVDVPEELI